MSPRPVDPLRRVAVLLLSGLLIGNAACAGDVQSGAALYRRHCLACHAPDGRPLLPSAPDFTRPMALMKADPSLLASIRSGRGGMPAYAGQLRDREILDIVAHLRTLR